MKNLFLTMALLVGLVVSAAPITTNSIVEKPDATIATVTDVDAFCKLIQQGNFEAVRSMVEAGIDINKKSVGMTPLMYAARYNKVEIVQLLIEHGADLKAKSSKGYTALKYAEISKAHDTYQVISDELKARKAARKGKKGKARAVSSY